MRTYAIGDIHGCYHTLIDLINKLHMERQDKLIFLGDYIDRGPFSKQVVEYVKQLTESGQAIALRGNHEQMCIDYDNGSGYWGQVWMQNGGGDTIDSYDTRADEDKIIPSMSEQEKRDEWLKNVPKVSEDHLAWMKELPFWHADDKFIYVHGGLIPGITFEDHGAEQEQEVLWVRQEFVRSNFNWGKIVVFGHTPFEKVVLKSNKIGLDTGCVYDGKLTAMCMDTATTYSVEKNEKDGHF